MPKQPLHASPLSSITNFYCFNILRAFSLRVKDLTPTHNQTMRFCLLKNFFIQIFFQTKLTSIFLNDFSQGRNCYARNLNNLDKTHNRTNSNIYLTSDKMNGVWHILTLSQKFSISKYSESEIKQFLFYLSFATLKFCYYLH